MDGWIKIHRQLLEWEWYDDMKVFRLFIHCLLKANHADKKYKGQLVKRGTFLTSRDLLSRETGLTIREVRTALNKLISTNELTNVSTRKGSVIAVINYDKYQKATNKKANERPTSDQRATTNKNDKNDKNDKNNNISDFDKAFKEFEKMRVKISAPLTERSRKIIMTKLQKLAVDDEQKKIEILEQSIVNCWKDVYPLKRDNNKPQDNTHKPFGGLKIL